MISYLKGRTIGHDDDGNLEFLAGEIGFRVRIHERDRRRLEEAMREGNSIDVHLDLWCRTVETETSTTIYGFISPLDRRLFDRIVKVEGCGPSTAMRVLGAMSPEDVVRERDRRALAPALAEIRGIGAKTALKLAEALA